MVSFGLLWVAEDGEARAWPEIFDPLQLLALNLEMDPGDWQTIQTDESLSIEVPAMMRLDGEAPILVAVRRKSGDPLTEASGFRKVSLKIDINELVPDRSGTTSRSSAWRMATIRTWSPGPLHRR